MKRLNQFEIFRFIGAIVVLMFHTARETTFFGKLPVILQNGPAWVYFYLLLSGFILTYSFYNNEKFNIKKFYTSRLAKLYPLYFISLLMICIFTGFKGKEKMIIHLFLLQDWVFPKALDYNAAAWYLSALTFLYLLFPILLKLYKKSEKTMIIFSIIILIYGYYIHILFLPLINNEIMHQLFNYFPLVHIGSFMMGISLCRISMKLKKRKVYSYLAIIYIIFLTYFMNNIPTGLPYIGNYITATFIPLIIFLSNDTGFFSKVLDNKLFIFLGSISYSIYIFHIPVQNGFSKFFPELNSGYFIFYLILVIIWSIIMTFSNRKISLIFKGKQTI